MVRALAILFLAAFLGQLAISSYAASEECSLTERDETSTDCTPFCATCSCCTTTHAFVHAALFALPWFVDVDAVPVTPDRNVPAGIALGVLHVPLV